MKSSPTHGCILGDDAGAVLARGARDRLVVTVYPQDASGASTPSGRHTPTWLRRLSASAKRFLEERGHAALLEEALRARRDLPSVVAHGRDPLGVDAPDRPDRVLLRGDGHDDRASLVASRQPGAEDRGVIAGVRPVVAGDDRHGCSPSSRPEICSRE